MWLDAFVWPTQSIADCVACNVHSLNYDRYCHDMDIFAIITLSAMFASITSLVFIACVVNADKMSNTSTPAQVIKFILSQYFAILTILFCSSLTHPPIYPLCDLSEYRWCWGAKHPLGLQQSQTEGSGGGKGDKVTNTNMGDPRGN